MQIRSYQPGDELAQARIFNTAAGSLPGFKPAKPEEIRAVSKRATSTPRQCSTPPKTAMSLRTRSSARVAVSVSRGACRREAAQEPLLEKIVREMKSRGIPNAWAAYRGDWLPVIDFLREHGFTQNRSMINYVAETSGIPPSVDFPRTDS